MKKNIKRGSAFIEILIATLLISAYAVPLYAWTSRMSGIQSKIEQRTTARSVLESSVAQFRATATDQRPPGVQSVPISDLPSGQLTITVVEEDAAHPSLLSYIATLTWQSVGGAQKMHIATYINNGG